MPVLAALRIYAPADPGCQAPACAASSWGSLAAAIVYSLRFANASAALAAQRVAKFVPGQKNCSRDTRQEGAIDSISVIRRDAASR